MRNGVQLALLSSLVFSVVNVLVKEASSTIPAAEIAFFRGFIGTLLIIGFMRRSQVSFSTKGIPMLAVRGVLGGLYMLTYFYTLTKLPLTDASILSQMSPLFVMLLSVIFLKETISRRTKMLLPVVIAGAFLLVKPYEYSTYSMIAVIGLLSALFAAGAGIAMSFKQKPSYV